MNHETYIWLEMRSNLIQSDYRRGIELTHAQQRVRASQM
jgi:hypothetical protein